MLRDTMKPGKLFEYIKKKGFTTISEASKELGVDTNETKEAIEKLRTKRHLRKLDMSQSSGCGSGSCAGCKGCSVAFAIQVDGTPIVYILSPFM